MILSRFGGQAVLFSIVVNSTIIGCGHGLNSQVTSSPGQTVVASSANVVLDVKSSDDVPVPSSLIQELTESASRDWAAWQVTFGLSGLRPPSVIKIQVQAVDGLAGRSGENEIHLARYLSGSELRSVFRHELGHIFLGHHAKEGCRGAEPSELYAEAFALWVSEDENRQRNSFPFASQARQYLRDRLGSTQVPKEKFVKQIPNGQIFHQQKAAQALSRLVAEARRLNPKGPNSFVGFFKSSLANCDFSSQAVSEVLFGETQKVTLSKESVLILDGISGETLLKAGESQFPVASILKPALIAEFPEFSRVQTSKSASAGSPAWLCPDNQAGRPWSWSRALALSCNGFFLDSDRPSKEAVRLFARKLRLFGFRMPEDLSVEQMIGLQPGIEASLESALAFYSWMAVRSPAVVTELKGTAIFGTLSGLPDSNWFSRNQIALKSGTIRNSTGQPEHGWIIAIGHGAGQLAGHGAGQQTDSARPTFLAAIHQRGSSPQLLLPRFRAHLQEVLTSKPSNREAKVQILGLVPRASLTAKCENHLLINGELPLGKSDEKSSLGLSALTDGTRLRCDRGPLTLAYPRTGGFSERKYWGEIEISAPSVSAQLSVPSVRQARARRGSEIILNTSERSYIAGVLASEFPSGRAETLKALALVVKFNLINANQLRHSGRPICDTTHCQVFGTRNRDVGAGPGERYSKVAQEVSELQLAGSIQDPWLMFSIGGAKPWSVEVAASEVVKNLKLQQPVFSVKRNEKGNDLEIVLGETGQGIRKKLSCEKFRNMLYLPSCPKTAELAGETWIFEGFGEGHGFGLDLVRADRMAAEGRTSREILRAHFPNLEVR